METGAPAATSFQPITIVELRRLWLDHHEHVFRSSVATINRYRTATDHLLNFVAQQSPNKQTSRFGVHDADAIVRYLRKLEVAPNGHANATKRRQRDKDVKYILEVCRSLFNFAIKRRHMPPYSENPFSVIEIDRIPVEDAKPFTDLSPEKEREFLEACDDWQFPIFATLLLTGLRGELTHLLLSHVVNLDERYIQIRNTALAVNSLPLTSFTPTPWLINTSASRSFWMICSAEYYLHRAMENLPFCPGQAKDDGI